MITAPDRLEALLAQDQVTGLDFVFVHADQVTLDIFFLRDPATLSIPLVGDLARGQVTIVSPSGGESVPQVALTETPEILDWVVVDGRDALRLTTQSPGDFTLYRLRIEDTRMDPYYNGISFSFKANCPSDLDCAPADHLCPPQEALDFPVDYLARDFWSYRTALLDFAAQRYPGWNDRLEADAGVMMAELMSALGDELAYMQDRIGREAFLESAGQRRSLRRHARLVDYPLDDGHGASSWLDLTVNAAGNLPAGFDAWAMSDNGRRVDYEVGYGLAEINAGVTYAVDPARNSLLPHLWDEDDTCLHVGATSLHLAGAHAADLVLDDTPPDVPAGKWVLLQTLPVDPAITARAWMVRLISVVDMNDPVFGTPVTLITWEEAQATPFELDLAVLEVRANLLPLTAGRRFEQRFVVGAEPDSLGLPEVESRQLSRALERTGPNGSTAYLFSLPEAESTPLVRLGEPAQPEVSLVEESFNGVAWVPVTDWSYRASLLGTHSSLPNDRHYTLDDGTWRQVASFQRNGETIVHEDYAANQGATVRFGDGEFGLIPPETTVFRLRYRLGNGQRGNVPAGAVTRFDDSLAFIDAVTNPLPIDNGREPEAADQVRLLAPEAFKARTYRAVRPEDYAEAAERLDWVQRAGAAFRWTGSWLSAFTTPDPLGATTIAPERRLELQEQLDRFRQSGREAHVSDPRYANIDLRIAVCVAAHAYRGQVEKAVREALIGRLGPGAEPGFFSPDRFTFGTPLERSALEAAIQEVPGVRAVEQMFIRRRGRFDWKPFFLLYFPVSPNEIIRLENDPLHPERGSLRLNMEGGA